jgi:hypothetical protein
LSAASCVASLAVTAPAHAIETGGAQQLPPPPPPPLTAAPPGAGAPAPAPAPAPTRRASKPSSSPAPTGSAPAASASVTASATPGADEGPDAGRHALDTRFFLAPTVGFASHYLDFGMGLRGGKTLDNHIYVGGSFLYQVGESPGPWSTSAFYGGPEVGYDFDLRVLVVRPYMGLGLFSWTSSIVGPAAGGSTSTTQVVAWPGCSVIWNVPRSDFFVGGDLRVVTVPGGSVGLYALAGLHFGT